ncbi:hypothetical protein BU204_28060 [Actinophytocola xanthii]|uniref:SMP-30/Gluconolactonase/LRE-like region domain-containing protein n=2 Tax=Actinophytocola xanthii TaxID=1912961 RepID=A0A1Q8CG42_9PSEU|nr:hypothetical protein BU204_28060 [Actinophytocola xanthii]
MAAAAPAATGVAQATHGHLPPVLTPAAVNQFPEGVAWDPTRQALLVGSVTMPPVISAVGRDGVARTVVTDPGVPAFLGLKVDARRGRIVAVYGVPGFPAPTGLGIYDLATGERERLVDLGGENHAPNDVALDDRGNAYVTDPSAGAVYRVDLAGQVTTVASDPRLGPAPGANGIAWHPDGYLLVVNHTTGRLYRLAGGRVSEVWMPEPLVGADGIGLRRDGTLVVVTNTILGLPGSTVEVHELAVVAGGRVALPLRATPWPDPAPTTVAVTPHGDYVLDGHLDVLFSGGTATDFVLRRV